MLSAPAVHQASHVVRRLGALQRNAVHVFSIYREQGESRKSKRRTRRNVSHVEKRKLCVSQLHFLIDLFDRLIDIRAAMNLQLYMRPILETFPVTTGKQAKRLGLGRIDLIAVFPVD